ncbi:hypothetical protein [Terrabacter koreensis]
MTGRREEQGSSVARSRSPLMLSAPMTRPMNSPKVMVEVTATTTEAFIVTSLRSLFVASR